MSNTITLNTNLSDRKYQTHEKQQLFPNQIYIYLARRSSIGWNKKIIVLLIHFLLPLVCSLWLYESHNLVWRSIRRNMSIVSIKCANTLFRNVKWSQAGHCILFMPSRTRTNAQNRVLTTLNYHYFKMYAHFETKTHKINILD